jgi:hypothetical protein
MIAPDARSLPHGAAPHETGRRDVAPAARGRDGIITHPIARLGSTTGRSVNEIALIRDTINHYGPVFIAPLSIRIRCAGDQKKFGGRASRREVRRNRPGPPTEQKIVAPDQNVRVVGWQVQKRRDGARRLTIKVVMPDQGQTITLPCILVPEDVQQLISDLS